ncbi:hypothetical protein [uncultured Ferrovibrio sp.]|jgi:hypothetical protein|uniref:hypothetical protein n=1 Tax=uncultured Ferrovibrio sp. TaxID=1576913 RepID=UPI00262056F1|nr:hypothetical protein [uncultured Ferrovibrio sp.]
MAPTSIANSIALPPSGGQVDSPSDSLRRQPALRIARFSPDAETPSSQAAAKIRSKAAADAVEQPFMRRRTDRGEPADSSLQIPPHLERRRAWREAFGLNTFHTQQLAQANEAEPSREARNAAAQAYHSAAWRGRLDLDLAQAVSVTV